MNGLPETVLQFGGGNFLRAFADLFIDEANRSGQAVGRVVIVQSTASGVADAINAQHGEYHVVIRGLGEGKRVDQVQTVGSVSRALTAGTQWPAVLSLARSPNLRYVLSNTTEAGFTLDDRDAARPAEGVSPVSFPAKLLDVLWARFSAGESASLAVLPCELLSKNGDRLHALVTEQAARWNAPPELLGWLDESCVWFNSLVDRIVSGKPAEHDLLDRDKLLTVAEPYAVWVIEGDPRFDLFRHPSIELGSDTTPYELRKIRILNGAHTALVARALPMGIATVREALEHTAVGPWLGELLHDEIVPTIEDRVPDAAGFAAATLVRFANPYLDHKLSAIALNHLAKLQTRLVPTRDEYVAKFGRRPRLLGELLDKMSTAAGVTPP